jgi:hypothetical protein
MAAGAGAIALSSVNAKEHARWKQAADRESQRYRLDAEYVQAALSGNEANNPSGLPAPKSRRTWLDYVLVIAVTTIFIALAVLARAPNMALDWPALAALAAAMLVFLLVSGLALGKTTRFN